MKSLKCILLLFITGLLFVFSPAYPDNIPLDRGHDVEYVMPSMVDITVDDVVVQDIKNTEPVQIVTINTLEAIGLPGVSQANSTFIKSDYDIFTCDIYIFNYSNKLDLKPDHSTLLNTLFINTDKTCIIGTDVNIPLVFYRLE